MSNKKTVRLAKLSKTARSDFTKLEQLPNVGPATAGYLKRVGVTRPMQLVGRDPFALYDELCRVVGVQYDPCLLDQFTVMTLQVGNRFRQLTANRSASPSRCGGIVLVPERTWQTGAKR